MNNYQYKNDNMSSSPSDNARFDEMFELERGTRLLSDYDEEDVEVEIGTDEVDFDSMVDSNDY